jgi:glutathione S-transferase
MEFLYTPTSPFSRKALVVAHELGIAGHLQLRSVHPRKEAGTVAERNPLGKIPALTTPESLVLYDSAVICAWLDATYGDGRLHPKGPRRWHVLREIALADGILEAASLVRQERLRPAALCSPELVAVEVGRIHRVLDHLESTVALFDKPLAMGQLSLACAFDWLTFRLPDQDWYGNRPRLVAAIDTLLERASFVATNPRV